MGDQRYFRHVFAVKRALDGRMGGLSVLSKYPRSTSVASLFEPYAEDDLVTRVMVVEVDSETDAVAVLRDQTFQDRIAGDPEEERRARRLDDYGDHTVHDVLFPACRSWPLCKHGHKAVGVA